MPSTVRLVFSTSCPSAGWSLEIIRMTSMGDFPGAMRRAVSMNAWRSFSRFASPISSSRLSGVSTISS